MSWWSLWATGRLPPSIAPENMKEHNLGVTLAPLVTFSRDVLQKWRRLAKRWALRLGQAKMIARLKMLRRRWMFLKRNARNPKKMRFGDKVHLANQRRTFWGPVFFQRRRDKEAVKNLKVVHRKSLLAFWHWQSCSHFAASAFWLLGRHKSSIDHELHAGCSSCWNGRRDEGSSEEEDWGGSGQ